MSEKDLENLDSQNQEGEGDHNDQDQDQNDDDSSNGDNQYTEREKGLYARLKKEEAARKELESKLAESAPVKKQESKQYDPEDISKTVKEVLQDEYLAEQEIPEDIKAKAKSLAKLENIDIKQALKNDYIQHQIAEYKRQESVANASAGGSNKGGSASFDPETPPEVDLSTEEGRKAFDEWEMKLEQHRKNK